MLSAQFPRNHVAFDVKREKILRNHLFKTEDVDEAIEWSEWNEADEEKRNVFAEMQFAFHSL